MRVKWRKERKITVSKTVREVQKIVGFKLKYVDHFEAKQLQKAMDLCLTKDELSFLADNELLWLAEHMEYFIKAFENGITLEEIKAFLSKTDPSPWPNVIEEWVNKKIKEKNNE